MNAGLCPHRGLDLTSDSPRRLTRADINAGRTARGGFTKAQLATWGVPWPPPKGWAKDLIAGRKVEPITESPSPQGAA